MYAPVDEADAVDNYRRILEIVGDIAGNTIAPRAETIDRGGQHAQRRRHRDAPPVGVRRTSRALARPT